MTAILKAIPYVIFWGWNLIFLTVVGLGILPHSGWLFFEAARGRIPLDFMAALLVLMAIPAVCTVLGLQAGIRNRWQQMVRLFFCIEAPLFLLMLLRLFLLRQVPAAGMWVLGSIVLSIGFYAFRRLGRAGAESDRPLFGWAS
ncbi:MAG: hypothetical protein AAFY15_02410 [Cyanobacteria bacterium J06648_11]